jgi:beta-lactamase class A
MCLARVQAVCSILPSVTDIKYSIRQNEKNASMKLTRRGWLLAAGTAVLTAAERRLSEEWRRIADTTDGTVGAAILQLSSGAIVSMNGDEPFPLASVCKIPIAMNILALVDEGKLALDK